MYTIQLIANMKVQNDATSAQQSPIADSSPYRPLSNHSSIRLFKLFPGVDDNPLHGELLDVISMNDSPSYEGVSYVWGSEENKAALYCDGTEMKITRNLAAALRQFRNLEYERLLWVSDRMSFLVLL